jgi:hypothetical protein
MDARCEYELKLLRVDQEPWPCPPAAELRVTHSDSEPALTLRPVGRPPAQWFARVVSHALLQECSCTVSPLHCSSGWNGAGADWRSVQWGQMSAAAEKVVWNHLVALPLISMISLLERNARESQKRRESGTVSISISTELTWRRLTSDSNSIAFDLAFLCCFESSCKHMLVKIIFYNIKKILFTLIGLFHFNATCSLIERALSDLELLSRSVSLIQSPFMAKKTTIFTMECWYESNNVFIPEKKLPSALRIQVQLFH